MLFEGEGTAARAASRSRGVHQDGLAADWFPFVRDARARRPGGRSGLPETPPITKAIATEPKAKRVSNSATSDGGEKETREVADLRDGQARRHHRQRGSEATRVPRRRHRPQRDQQREEKRARRGRSRSRRRKVRRPRRSRATPEGEGEGCAADYDAGEIDELNGLSLACLHRHVGYQNLGGVCVPVGLPAGPAAGTSVCRTL